MLETEGYPCGLASERELRETDRREGSLLSLGLGLFTTGTSMWGGLLLQLPV